MYRMAFLLRITSNLHLLMQDFVQSPKNRTFEVISSPLYPYYKELEVKK